MTYQKTYQKVCQKIIIVIWASVLIAMLSACDVNKTEKDQPSVTTGTEENSSGEIGAEANGVIETAEFVAVPYEAPTENLSERIDEAKAQGNEPLACASGCPFPNYNVSGSCCNLAGCNCDGPCWNAGCKTTCQAGKYPGKTTSCPGKDKFYNCCATGSKCKSSKTCSAKSGGCCCTGKGVTVLSVSSIEYDLSNSTKTPDAVASKVSYQYKGSNSGPNAHPVGTVKSFATSTQTTQWSFETATEISASAEVSAGIPFFGDGKLTVGAKETFKYGETHSKSITTSLEISLGDDQIPAYSNQSYIFQASMYQFNIPFKAVVVVLDDCGNKKDQTITGSTKLGGVASFTDGEFSKIIGPAVPVECKEPFDTPIDEQRSADFCSSGPMCKDNALCVRYGQTKGTCCATGSEQPCCAVAAANPACVEQGYDADKQLCPATNGNFAPCCNSRDSLSKTYKK